MKRSFHRLSPRYILIFVVILTIVPVVVLPDKYISSVYDGFKLYALSVLPALFPFFFFSKILSELNFGYDLGLALKKPLKKLYRAPGLSGYILVMSMLSGYPVGAKLIADFYDQGMLTKDEAKGISAFTSTSGPLFIVGTVGIAMLGSKTAGFIILLSHYLASLLNGFLFRAKKTESVTLPAIPMVKFDRLLGDSMVSAIISVAIVGGYIAVFNMLMDVFFDIGLIGGLAKLFSYLGVNIRLGEGLFASLVEMTKGSLILSRSGFGLNIVAPLCAFGVTFGGLSVTLQSLTFLSKCKISPAFYLFSKLTQGLLAFFICLGLSALIF